MNRELRVCVTEVPAEGQGDPHENAVRITRAARLIHGACAHLGLHLLVLPGGFLCAPSEAALIETAEPLIDAARSAGLAIIFGIETDRPLVAAWAPDMSAPVFRACETRPRLLRVAGHTVAVFLEDEHLDHETRAAVAATYPDLAVVCTRDREHRGLWKFRRLGFPITSSAHAPPPSLPPLVCPRGWRLGNLSFMEHTFFCSIFYVDELDGALDAA